MKLDELPQGDAKARTDPARLYPPYPLLAVSLAVFRAGRVLLATRTRPPYAGEFSLPGGLVESGETLENAALRELREEVQVEARIVAFNRHVESIHRDRAGRILRHYVIASFVGEWLAGEGSPGPEAGEVVWASPSSLALLKCTPHVEATVAAAQTMLKART
jgi:ADP-ribose pyrophosphatase YjhB (NUDIX family)